MTKRFRVFKIDNMYGVSDDIANYTIAWDTSKIIMDGLCDLLNNLNDENEHLIKKRGELETKNVILEGENEKLKQELDMFNPVIFNNYRGGVITLYKKEG